IVVGLIMTYSDDNIKRFYRQIAAILKFDNKGIASLEDLKKEGGWKEINFQEKCEGDNSLGDLLLKLEMKMVTCILGTSSLKTDSSFLSKNK
ncbi:MAG: hypothetical protein ACR5KV_09450, partial [Wolbachia sp.]